MVNLLQAMHGRRNAFHSSLELERQKLRIVTRLVQVAAMKPKRLLLGRLPHISLLTFPWARVFSRVRAQSPNLAYLVSSSLGNQICCPAVHRTITGSVNDKISRQLGAFAQDDGILRELFDIDTDLQLDAAIGNELRSTDIDVVSRSTSQILHEQT